MSRRIIDIWPNLVRFIPRTGIDEGNNSLSQPNDQASNINNTSSQGDSDDQEVDII